MKTFPTIEQAFAAALAAAEVAASARSAATGKPFVAEPFGASGTSLLGYYVAAPDGEGHEEFAPAFSPCGAFLVEVSAHYEDPKPTHL